MIAGGTAACLAASLAVNYLLLFSPTLTPFGRSVVSAVAVPLLIGMPVFLYVGTMREELRRYRRALTRAASHDLVTDCFNGSAFSSLIERRATQPQLAGQRHGAFLIVEVGKMREINMRFGFAWSDEALKLVAATIRASVRGGDIVGRISADEFGIFLPGAGEEQAAAVGERIRAGVKAAYFTPANEAGMLEVGVGGVVFEKDLSFDDMFRATERLMAEAGPAERMRLSFIDRGERPATL
ncbi:MAG: GGDEF domain-containing protein [Rhizobiaceae bacterium]